MQLFTGIYHKKEDLHMEIYLDLDLEDYRSDIVIDGVTYDMTVKGGSIIFNGDVLPLIVRKYDNETIVSGKNKKWSLFPCIFSDEFFVATNKISYL